MAYYVSSETLNPTYLLSYYYSVPLCSMFLVWLDFLICVYEPAVVLIYISEYIYC